MSKRRASWLFPHNPIDAETVRLFPRRAFDKALEESRQTRELEQRALTRSELSALKALYPEEEYTQAEAAKTYQQLGRLYKPDPLPTWEQIELELSAEPASSREATQAEAEREPARRAQQPQLPRVVNSYTHATIARGVRAYRNGATRNEVAALPNIGPHDAGRIRKLLDGALLALNDRGKLIVSPRVATIKGRIVLRYLDERGERWLDPADVPPPVVPGGRG